MTAVSGGQTNEGFTITKESLREPRPLKVHVLKVDLEFPGIEVVVAVADDPDGDGPAESFLMAPPALAKEAGLDVVVNAAPWAMVPATPEGQSPQYIEGGHCDILGLTVEDGKELSPTASSAWSLWQDQQGNWHLGSLPDGEFPKQAVSGFGPLVSEGNLVTTPSDVLHPRTAVGIDEQGKFLTIVVVDGRQPGVSEGMSEHELAELMKRLGCWNALNLDGGGSSVLLQDASRSNPKIINRPSGGTMRPVPVIIGLRSVKE
ncbi:MAG: phosphodiester glycosidase family protein [Terrimicrobiaceae bacterium]